MAKRPSYQFYPGDWRKDAALQSCSLAARGLWQEMLCIMHECMPYGHLSLEGRAIMPNQLARLVGESEKVVMGLLTELIDTGVCGRTDRGTFYSRRMVRDEAIRNARADGGSSGAEFGILGAEHGKKGGRPAKDKGGLETPLSKDELTPLDDKIETPIKPPPSSSSSSSSKAKTKPSAAPSALPDPPEWVEAEAWAGFVENRKRIRFPLTPRAANLVFAELERLRSAGNDPSAVLDQATRNGWRDVFPLRQSASKSQDDVFAGVAL